MIGSVGNFLKKAFLSVDLYFLVCIVSIGIFGLFAISGFSTDDARFLKQAAWIVIGVIVFIITSRIDFSFLQDTKAIIVIYGIINAILGATLAIGFSAKGSTAWLSFGGVSLQAADFAKLALVLLLAKYFSKRHIEIQQLKHIIVTFIYTIIPVGLILLQPDLGSALVLMGIWFLMVLISGLSRKHLITMVLLGVMLFSYAWVYKFEPYQKNRVLDFINPLRDIRGSGYNVYQSQIAIGSGGVFGKGVGFGTQSRLNFLPEHETDFIFAAFAEEWGFVGVVILCALMIIILLRILYISFSAHNNFATLIGMGVFAWLLIHILVNMGMNLGLLPVTGIPLPFMSYGGSHFLAECLALGIVASFAQKFSHARRRYNNEFLGLE